MVLCGIDCAAFLGGGFFGRLRVFAFQGFFRGAQHGFRFVARFDQLALGKILLGILDRFLEHPLDFSIV